MVEWLIPETRDFEFKSIKQDRILHGLIHERLVSTEEEDRVIHSP